MIVKTDAIVDPRTVVIVALDTVVTDGAMPAAARFYAFAVGTQLISVDVLEHVQEVDTIIGEVAGLSACGH